MKRDSKQTMFTGIIEETGTVERIKPCPNAIRMTVRVRAIGTGLKIGGSLAVNGCCLTITGLATRGRERLVHFDLLQETWRLTNLQCAQLGSLVNLERPLRAGGELGGHFVTGHVDGLGLIKRWEKVKRDYVLDIEAPAEVMRHVIHKGSVAVDGISLTVAAVRQKGFRVWIIPHTYEVTALKERKVGDPVNLEADMLGKYAAKFLVSKKKKSTGG